MIDTKISSLDDKITENKNNLKDTTIDTVLLSEGRGSKVWWGDGFQAYLIFQPVHKYFQTITDTNYISSWKPKGLSAESIELFPTSDNSLTPLMDYHNYNIRVKFNGSILRQPKVTYTHGKSVNTYILYELGASSSHINDPSHIHKKLFVWCTCFN